MYFPTAIHPFQNTLSLDDYLQLQMLLRHEQAEREQQRLKEEAILQEQKRLQNAMDKLNTLLHEYRRERYRHIDRIQRYHQEQEAKAAILARQEEQERLRQQLANAIEHRRLEALQQQYLQERIAKQRREKEEEDEAVRRQQKAAQEAAAEEAARRQQQDRQDSFEAYRAKQMAEFVKLLFEHSHRATGETRPCAPPNDKQEGWDDLMCCMAPEDQEKAQNTVDETMAEATEQALDLSKAEESHDDDSHSETSSSDGSTPPLDPHVMTVKELINELASTEPPTEQDDVAANNGDQGPATATEDPINSAKDAKLKTLYEIQSQLNDIERRSSDIFDHRLHFQAPSDTLMLSTTVNNRAFLGYEDAMMQILLKVDAIESNGDSEIRTARKSIVRQAEQALERLDAHKQAEWEKARRAERRQTKKMKRRQERRPRSIPVF